MLNELEVTINGTAPILLHNGQLDDPLNAHTKALKEVSSKRKKTNEDHAEMSRLEWIGSLYVDGDGYVAIPDSVIESSVIGGAKKSELGTAFKSAVFCKDTSYRLEYGGRRKALELWGDEKFRDVRGVRVGQSRVMRTRPRFDQWSLSFTMLFDDEQVNKSDVVKAIEDAGRMVGIGDFRPKFGRFEVAA